MSDWCSSALFMLEIVVFFVILYFFVDWLLHRSVIEGGPTNRWVLITGCDTGLGNLAAKRLDSIGCRVIAGCLTAEGMSELRQQCSSRLFPVLMDVASDESVQTAFKTVSDLIGPGEALWGLINNAGIAGPLAPVEWMTIEELTQPFQVNTVGAIRVTRAFLPLMKRSTSGCRLVNVASILGRVTVRFTAPYAISKHAIEALSDALRLELAPFNIRVSIIEPGYQPTNINGKTEDFMTKIWNRLPESTRQLYGTSYRDQVLSFFRDILPVFGSSKPDGVIAAYEHALFNRRPRPRYLVGLDSVVLAFFGLLPTGIFDFLLSVPGVRAVPAGCR